MDMYELKETPNPNIMLALEASEVVHIWNINSCKESHVIKTHFDLGGSRFALSRDNDVLITGAFKKFGVEAYDIVSGIQLWKREDLKLVQKITTSQTSNYAFICFDDHIAMLDIHSGQTVSEIEGFESIIHSRFGNIAILEGERNCEIHIVDTTDELNVLSKSQIMPSSFALLKADFSKEMIFVTEANTRLRAFAEGDLTLVWEIEKNSANFISLKYNKSFHLLFARDYNNTFVVFEPESGRELYRKQLPSRLFFNNDGSSGTTTEGEVFILINKEPYLEFKGEIKPLIV